MPTLKHVLIAVAAAAVSVFASPLSTDATATTTISAPKSTVSEISKPLEGKDLEDFLAGYPHTPEGSIDITNTTLATELTTALTKRSGGCNQGECPDFHAAFDFYRQHYVTFSNGQALNYWFYWGRWNDCGQCGEVATSNDGCFDFTSCGRKQSICVDAKNSRAHRIWKDKGAKECYKTKRDYLLPACPPVAASDITHPIEKVACNW
ncbi:hypothetical protein ACLOAV_006507 [Pseudogymnoascus australis]